MTSIQIIYLFIYYITILYNIMNSTSSDILDVKLNDLNITHINIFTTDQTHGADWNEWYDGGTCEHIIDVCSSNNNYPIDSVRIFFEAQDIQEMWSRYNLETRIQTGHISNTNFRPAVSRIRFNPPVLCEAGNYVRLFRNGDSSALTNLAIGVIGYFY
jgi:hypothetical protein